MPGHLYDCTNPECSETTPFRDSLCASCSVKHKQGGSQNATKYPKYYKSVEGLSTIDVYQVHQLFNIQDPSGAIQHASKKLLLSGCRTGGKSQYEDIKEARDTLNRWLEMNHTFDGGN